MKTENIQPYTKKHFVESVDEVWNKHVFTKIGIIALIVEKKLIGFLKMRYQMGNDECDYTK